MSDNYNRPRTNNTGGYNKSNQGYNSSSNEAANTKVTVDGKEVDFDPQWITLGMTEESGIKYCEAFAIELAKAKLTTSQIRIFFGEVRRIQNKGIKAETIAFRLLKPKLAYAKAKGERNSLDKFKVVMDKAMDAVIVNKETTFDHFCEFLEATLAYHKSHGGR